MMKQKMTRREDYLKLIYTLSQKGEVRGADLADELELPLIKMPKEATYSAEISEIIDRVRRENDERYELAVQERERKEKLRSFVSMNRQFAQQTPRPQPARTVMTYEERVRVGKQQVIGKFDRDDNELVYDSFNLRWLKCRFCGEIKPEGEMATYGGREGAKMGTCRDCSRK